MNGRVNTNLRSHCRCQRQQIDQVRRNCTHTLRSAPMESAASAFMPCIHTSIQSWRSVAQHGNEYCNKILADDICKQQGMGSGSSPEYCRTTRAVWCCQANFILEHEQKLGSVAKTEENCSTRRRQSHSNEKHSFS